MKNQKNSRHPKSYKNLYQRFIRIRGNPRQIASGFALGIFIGMSPTMGLQILMAVFFASLLKWNKISATIGVLITNAFTAPLLYTMTYLMGAKVMGITNQFEIPRQMNWDIVIELMEKAPTILGAMTVGGIIVGLPLAIVAYGAAYYLSDRYQNRIKNTIQKLKPKSIQKREPDPESTPDD